MKNLTTKIAFALVFLLLLVSIGLNVKQDFEKSKKEKETTALLTQGGQNKVVEKYTRDSVTHTIFNEKIINNTTSEKVSALDRTYADSLQKALKVSLDKIDQVTKINGRLEAQLALQTKVTNTGKTIKTHKDQYLDLVYFPDSDSLNMAYNIELNDARYPERKWFLGKTQHYIDLFSNDKRVTINGVKSFRLKESPSKRFGIGFSAGYGLALDGNVVKAVPYVGISGNYNLVEF